MPLLRSIRLNSSSTKPPKAEVTPTTFSDKSAPRNVHDRPEQIRGFPPMGSGPKWTKPAPKTDSAESERKEYDAFDGPSRPRLIYARQPRRDLPDFKVGPDLHQSIERDTDCRTNGRSVSLSMVCSPCAAHRSRRLGSIGCRSMGFVPPLRHKRRFVTNHFIDPLRPMCSL